MKHIKTYEDINNELKVGDYITFPYNIGYNGEDADIYTDDNDSDTIANFPYKIIKITQDNEFVINGKHCPITISVLDPDIIRVSKDEAEKILNMKKYNL